MKKMLGLIIGGLIAVYVILSVASHLLPDWFRILWNADPRYIDHALDVAKKTYRHDKE